MKLDVTPALRAPGEDIPFRVEGTLPPQDVLGDAVTFPALAVMQGKYRLTDERLQVRGRLLVEAHSQCARCLAPAIYRVDIPVDEAYTRLEQGETAPDDPWEEKLTFTGSAVDLSHLAMSLAVLDLPIRFSCGPDCPGAPEGAQPPEIEDTAAGEHPFSALKQLFNPEEEV